MKLTSTAILGASVLALGLVLAASSDVAQAGSRENFIAADRNRDGALTRREFRVFIDKNAAQNIGYAPMIKSQNMYDEAFDMVDTNGDGKFSLNEVPSAPGETAASVR
jgi:Ca2+-binding EF-hand superfamily protein